MSIRLFVIFSILVFQESMFAQPVWHLIAEIAKESYIAGEPIDVGISVTNLSVRTIRANLPSAYGRLTNEEGERLFPRLSIHGFFSPRETLFVSGQEDYRVVDLNFLYGGRVTNFSGLNVLPKGSYRFDLFLDAADAQPESVSISFRVAEATGDEAMVYDRLKAILLASEQAGPSAAAPFAHELRNLAETHPASVYAPGILSQAEAYYHVLLEDLKTARELDRRIVEMYPGSSVAQGHIAGIFLVTPSREERIAILKRIRDKAPQNAPMRRSLDQQLRKEERR